MKKKTTDNLLKSTKKLMVVFILLLALVIFLFVLCIIKYNESKKNDFANMIIPVYELNSNYEFSINAKILSEVNEYTFKIVNYKKNDINKEEIPYKVEIRNDTKSKIKVIKEEKEIINLNESFVDENTLKMNEKEDIYYRIKITKSKELTTDDLIYVKISN